MKLTDLAINHPYYTSECNYYCSPTDFPVDWDTMSDFLDEFEDMDVDYNLCTRFDIWEWTEDYTDDPRLGEYGAQILLILQRKGIYAPHWINTVEEHEVPRLVAYLKKHWRRLQQNWAPISQL